MIPYRKVAEEALYKWNYKDNIEDQKEALKKAHEDAETLSYDELESKIHATGSMNYAIEGITKYLLEQGEGLTLNETEQYNKAVFEGPEDADIFRAVGDKIGKVGDTNKLVLSTLSDIHDKWVKDNEKKFTDVNRNKQYQHMPIELIGWEEATIDLLFLKPILEASGIEIDEKVLENTYEESVMQFLNEKGISSTADLQSLMQQGADFYPALEGQKTIEELLAESQYVNNVITPQIENKGIGNIEQFISEHKKTLTPLDIENATQAVSITGINTQTQVIKDEFAKEQQLTTEENEIEQ